MVLLALHPPGASLPSTSEGRPREAITVVADASQIAQLRWWQQGDLQLNTAEALQLRAENRRVPIVLAELEKWWQAAVQGTFDVSEVVDCSLLDRVHYTSIFRKIALALLEDDEAEEVSAAISEAMLQADEGWREDSRGRPCLERKQWYDSLFELADTWTADVAPTSYATFLRCLLETVARRDAAGISWRRDDEVFAAPKAVFGLGEPRADERSPDEAAALSVASDASGLPPARTEPPPPPSAEAPSPSRSTHTANIAAPSTAPPPEAPGRNPPAKASQATEPRAANKAAPRERRPRPDDPPAVLPSRDEPRDRPAAQARGGSRSSGSRTFATTAAVAPEESDWEWASEDARRVPPGSDKVYAFGSTTDGADDPRVAAARQRREEREAAQAARKAGMRQRKAAVTIQSQMRGKGERTEQTRRQAAAAAIQQRERSRRGGGAASQSDKSAAGAPGSEGRGRTRTRAQVCGQDAGRPSALGGALGATEGRLMASAAAQRAHAGGLVFSGAMPEAGGAPTTSTGRASSPTLRADRQHGASSGPPRSEASATPVNTPRSQHYGCAAGCSSAAAAGTTSTGDGAGVGCYAAGWGGMEHGARRMDHGRAAGLATSKWGGNLERQRPERSPRMYHPLLSDSNLVLSSDSPGAATLGVSVEPSSPEAGSRPWSSSRMQAGLAAAAPKAGGWLPKLEPTFPSWQPLATSSIGFGSSSTEPPSLGSSRPHTPAAQLATAMARRGGSAASHYRQEAPRSAVPAHSKGSTRPQTPAGGSLAGGSGSDWPVAAPSSLSSTGPLAPYERTSSSARHDTDVWAPPARPATPAGAAGWASPLISRLGRDPRERFQIAYRTAYVMAAARWELERQAQEQAQAQAQEGRTAQAHTSGSEGEGDADAAPIHGATPPLPQPAPTCMCQSRSAPSLPSAAWKLPIGSYRTEAPPLAALPRGFKTRNPLRGGRSASGLNPCPSISTSRQAAASPKDLLRVARGCSAHADALCANVERLLAESKAWGHVATGLPVYASLYK